jgi:peptide/nickel transport system permease protein
MSLDTSTEPAVDAVGTRQRTKQYAVIYWLARDKAVLASLVFILAVVLAAIFAPWLSPYDPTAMDLGSRYLPVGTPGHVLGTDQLGRDVLSRLLWGGRLSLLIGILPVAIATVISFALGLTAGYAGGWVDTIIMRMLDIWFAFPMLLLALLLIAIVGPGLVSEVGAITVGMVPYIGRLARTSTVSEKAMDYVVAARAAGAGVPLLLIQEILPNVIPPVLAYCATLIGISIVIGSGLSFLGLGVQPPAADWGLMLSEGQDVMREAPHVTVIPGLMILSVAVAFNLLSDGLRDLLDPRLKA